MVPTPQTTPVISTFEYVTGIVSQMFACNATKIYDVTTSIPALAISGRTSGNHAAAQLANAGDDYLIVVNDAGDPVLRYDGTIWANLTTTTPTAWTNSHAYVVGDRALDETSHGYWKCAIAHTSPASGTFEAARIATPAQWTIDMASDDLPWITGPPGSAVENGANLVYVCKYRNRLFFIEKNSMNAWYLGIDSVGGALLQIPLSGAASKGGKLVFCAVWSIISGSGTDDKLVFMTSLARSWYSQDPIQATPRTGARRGVTT